MNYKEMSKITIRAAEILDKKIASKYPVDVGYWALEEDKIDELKRHLSKLKVSLAVYELDEKEFPTLKNKNLVEIQIRSDVKSEDKALDVLKRAEAFELEQHHITNLKQKDKEEYLFSKNAPEKEEAFDKNSTVTIDIKPDFYDKKTKTFSFEMSDVDLSLAPQEVILKNPNKNTIMKFKKTHEDKDGTGEDTYGFWYKSEKKDKSGNQYKLLIIND